MDTEKDRDGEKKINFSRHQFGCHVWPIYAEHNKGNCVRSSVQLWAKTELLFFLCLLSPSCVHCSTTVNTVCVYSEAGSAAGVSEAWQGLQWWDWQCEALISHPSAKQTNCSYFRKEPSTPKSPLESSSADWLWGSNFGSRLTIALLVYLQQQKYCLQWVPSQKGSSSL